jgi:multidrug efflux pump
VPIGNFIKRVAAERTGVIKRLDGKRVVTVSANVEKGVQVAAVQAEVIKALEATDFKGLVSWKLAGSNEESDNASAFLGKAFGAAIFLIFAVLLAQFNKLSSVMLVLFAIILSTIGVFLGLMIMQQPFGIVMTGVGIISLAGIVTNNNIVLIDTYDRLRKEGVPVEEAIIRTCRERARPVLLTAGAAVLGVLPIAFGLNVNFVHRTITYGAPSTQWWVQLSTAIVFGLTFATILTLVVTPAQLAFLAKLRRGWDWLFRRGRRQGASGGGAPAHARNTDGDTKTF